MRTSLPVPTLSPRAIILGIVTVVVLMGITHQSFASVDQQAPYSNVDPRAPYSTLDQNDTIANAEPLSPPG